MRTEFTVGLQCEERGGRARMQMIVVMKLTEPRIVPKPEKARPMIHMSAPTPGDRTASESGE